VEKKIRGLAWVVTHWARDVRPKVIILENVLEFQDWGPLGKDNRPLKRKKGWTFKRWKARLRNLGYQIDHRPMIAADYGTPTIRKRFFMVARSDGKEIRWPGSDTLAQGKGPRGR
jgi:DNA (cytosine-5)-methyltransferase 1